MDPDQFVAMYRQEAEAVLLFHARRTFDAEIALELTADTFAEAWRSRRSLRAEGGIERRAWLFTIARRRWAAYLEKGRLDRKALRQLRVQLPTFHEDDLAQVDERAGLPELRRELGAELARLTADQRDALQLRVVDEYGYPEVARRLGISEQNARARVSRGLRALSAALEPRYGDVGEVTTDAGGVR